MKLRLHTNFKLLMTKHIFSLSANGQKCHDAIDMDDTFSFQTLEPSGSLLYLHSSLITTFSW